MTGMWIEPGDILVFLIVISFFIAFRVIDKKDSKMSKARRYIEKQSEQLKSMIDRHTENMNSLQEAMDEKESSAREMLKRVESLLQDIDSHADDLIELQRQLTHYHKVLKDLSMLTDKAEKRLQIVNSDIGKIDTASEYLDRIEEEKKSIQQKLLQTRSLFEKEISQARTTIHEEVEEVRRNLESYSVSVRRDFETELERLKRQQRTEAVSEKPGKHTEAPEASEELEAPEEDAPGLRRNQPEQQEESAEIKEDPASEKDFAGSESEDKNIKPKAVEKTESEDEDGFEKNRRPKRDAQPSSNKTAAVYTVKRKTAQDTFDYEAWNAWSKDISKLNKKPEGNGESETEHTFESSSKAEKSDDNLFSPDNFAFEDIEEEGEESLLDDQEEESPVGRDSRREEVASYLKQGYNASQIAVKTGLQRSEVELFIELIQFKQDS